MGLFGSLGGLLGNIGKSAGGLLQTGSNLLSGGRNLFQGIGNLFGGGGVGVTDPIGSGSQSNFLGLPNSLLGGGLLLGSTLADKEPGEITEARQFLRNRFTSPNALSDQFSQQIGGLSQQFQPLLTQQRQRGIDDISQRFAAAFPGTVGAQGSEFGSLSRYITDEALPREQALLGDLGLRLLDAQERAAGTILNTNKPNGLAEGLGQLGGSLLNRGLIGGALGQGGQGTGGGGFGGDGGSLLSGAAGLLGGGQNLLGMLGLTPGGIGANPQAAAGLTQALQGLFPGQAIGGLEEIGNGAVALLDQQGNVIGSVGANGQIINQQTGQVMGNIGGGGPGAGGGGFQGLLGSPGFGSGSGILSGLATGAAGAFIGNKIGQQFNSGSATQAKGALGGAAGGAAAGFAIGGPFGGVIGGLAGAISGLFGSSSAERARKDASIAQETQQTNALRPEALQNAAGISQAAAPLSGQLQALRNSPNLQSLATNPQAQQIIQQAVSQLSGIKNQFNAGAIADIFGTPNVDFSGAQGLGNFLSLLNGVAVRASQLTDPSQIANPESEAGLIRSAELGKFGPGVELVKMRQQQLPIVYNALNALAQLV